MTTAVTYRRVSMGDVDQVLAFYGRYFYWMDDGIHALLDALGHPLRTVLSGGHGMPVVDARCRYDGPVDLDDVVEVETAVVAARRSSFDVGHVMTVNGRSVAVSRTTHVWVSRGDQVTSEALPEWLAAAATTLSGFDLA